MALGQGDTVTAEDFNRIRNLVAGEASRRDRYTFSTITNTIGQGSPCSSAEINTLINTLRTINTTTTNFDPVSVGTLMRSIAQLESAQNNLSAYLYNSNSSGCASGCLGMCQSCTGNCVSGCTSCTSCTGCSGCSSCSGSCTGTCSGCSGSCTGSCTGCSGCSSCTGSCSGCTSCTNKCKGCGGVCADCDYHCDWCGVCGGYTKPIKDLMDQSKYLQIKGYEVFTKDFIEVSVINYI